MLYNLNTETIAGIEPIFASETKKETSNNYVMDGYVKYIKEPVLVPWLGRPYETTFFNRDGRKVGRSLPMETGHEQSLEPNGEMIYVSSNDNDGTKVEHDLEIGQDIGLVLMIVALIVLLCIKTNTHS